MSIDWTQRPVLRQWVTLVALAAMANVASVVPFSRHVMAQQPDQPTPAEQQNPANEPVPIQQAPVDVVAPAKTPARRVALFAVPKNAAIAQESLVLQSMLRGAVAKLDGVAFADAAPARNPDNLVRAASLVENGNEWLNKDPAVYPNYREEALNRYQTAYDMLLASPGGADMRLLGHAAKGLGVAKLLTGTQQEAARLMRQSLLVYPMQSSVEYAYTPEAQEAFEQVVRDTAAEASGSIQVKTLPDGAEVFVDGKLQGYAPLTVNNLTAGEHYVTVFADGHWKWAEFVAVPPGGTVDKMVELAAAPSLPVLQSSLKDVQRKWNAKGVGVAAQNLKEAANADEVILLRVDKNKQGEFILDGFTVRLSGDVAPTSATIAPDAKFLDNIRLFIEGQTGAGTVSDAGAVPLSMPLIRSVALPVSGNLGTTDVIDPNSQIFNTGGEEDESIVNEWWFWTLIGVGVAGAAVAIALPLTLGEEESSGGPKGGIHVKLVTLP
ncbi:MAG: PEGA domain-containing protein [Myxococcales bacterium]|nr:PEGA domain-containing protein [Myxococcales bacterium]